MGCLPFSNVCFLSLDFKEIVVVRKEGVELPKVWLNNCSERLDSYWELEANLMPIDDGKNLNIQYIGEQRELWTHRSKTRTSITWCCAEYIGSNPITSLSLELLFPIITVFKLPPWKLCSWSCLQVAVSDHLWLQKEKWCQSVKTHCPVQCPGVQAGRQCCSMDANFK